MNNPANRLFGAFLLLITITILWSRAYCYYKAPAAMTEQQWKAYKIVYGLDPLQRLNNSKGFFNIALWEDKGLIAYGDYSSIYPNDFKPVKGGYYLQGSIEGEYRYHGYGTDEAKITNSDFPRDASSTTPLSEKNWYYRPWEKSSPAYYLYSKHVGSSMTLLTKAALGLDQSRTSQEIEIIRKWMSDGLGYQIRQGTGTGFDSISDLSVYNYLTVVSPPTPSSSGTGIMMHKSKYGGNWYQAMTISKIEDKLMPSLRVKILSIKATGYSSNGDVTLEIAAEGSLSDEGYFSSDVLRSVYFTRFDIENWKFGISSSYLAVENDANEVVSGFGNSNAKFRIVISRDKYIALMNDQNEFSLDLKIVSEAIMHSQGKKASGSFEETYKIKGMGITEPTKLSSAGSPDFSIDPAREMLDVESFRLNIIMKQQTETMQSIVKVDSVELSEADKKNFLADKFIFPDHDETKIHSYEITFISKSGAVSSYSSNVVVYDTKPILSIHVIKGDLKEGLPVEVKADISDTPEYVIQKTQTKADSIRVFGQGTTSEIISDDSLRFWVNHPAEIRISAHAYNEYTESVIEKTFNIREDMPPDIQLQSSESAILRGSAIKLISTVSSTDGDEIDTKAISLKMDMDSDGVYETNISELEHIQEIEFSPRNLGSYSIEVSAKERKVPGALEGYPRSSVKKLFFEVANAAPVTKLSSVGNEQMKKVDVTFLVDISLPQADKASITSSLAGSVQKLLSEGIDAKLDFWNVGTFLLNKTVEQRIHTASTYPASSTTYSSDGYSGTLPRVNIEDYPYVNDLGSYVTVTESRTFTKYSQTNLVTGKGRTNPYVTDSVTYSNPAPATFPVDEDGYMGQLPRTSTIKVIEASYIYSPIYYDPVTKTNRQTWTSNQGFQAVYSGTLSKTYTIWKPNPVTFHDYYGVYRGSVSKPYQESYTPNYRTDSDKVAVYVTRDSVSGKNQLDELSSKVDNLRTISIATKTGETLIPDMERIAYSSVITNSINELVERLSASYPSVDKVFALVGKQVKIDSFDTDLENDPIDSPLHQYVHDPEYFENPLGVEDGCVISYSDDGYLKVPLKTVFSKPGKYVLYRKVRDLPQGSEEFSKYSVPARLEVLVHRKPESDFLVIDTYNPSTGAFDIKINDSSYDPDHRSSAGRGIIKTSFRFKMPSGEWIYKKPSSLSAGTYTFAQSVLDAEGAWSDETTKTVTIKANPGVKLIKAEFSPIVPAFSLSAIPATEGIKSLSIETKYAYAHSIEASIVDAMGNEVLKPARYGFDSSKDAKVKDVISWRSISLIIPETLRNGEYRIRLKAFDLNVPSIYDVVEIPMTVFTPASIKTGFDSLLKGRESELNSTTSKYVKSLSAVLFDGTSLQKKVDFVKDPSTNVWKAKYVESRDIEEGNYFIRFTAAMASGQTEIFKRDFKYEAFRIENHRIHGEWNHWRGQKDKITGEILEINTTRFLGLESIGIEVEIEGNPDKVQLTYPEKWKDVNANGFDYTQHTGLSQLPSKLVNVDGKYRIQLILPAVDQTMDYKNRRLGKPYEIEVLIKDGVVEKTLKIEGIEVTGSIFDLIYFLPKE